MKTIVLFIRCAGVQIKNYFFKSKKYDNNHACREWEKLNEELAADDGKNPLEEYLNDYRGTTRWQTL